MMTTLPKKNQSGQILLVILLIMAVTLTIGLSIVSRSVTDIELSSRSDEAARAFSAAEAGIEEGLITGSDSAGVVNLNDANSSYQTNTENIGLGKTAYAFPGEYSTDQIQTFWFASYDATTETYTKVYDRDRIRVAWGNENTTTNPALLVTIYYKDTADLVNPYKTGRFALDPINRTTSGSVCSDPSGSNCFCYPGAPAARCSNVLAFINNGETIDGKVFKYRVTLDLGSSGLQGTNKTLLFARLRLLYTNEPQILGIQSAGSGGINTFPSQGVRVTSVGQSGATTRKVEVNRMLPAPPAIFDFTVYSAGDLTH